jgi:hypothetical protein
LVSAANAKGKAVADASSALREIELFQLIALAKYHTLPADTISL